jgi:mRNA-degrading endonuclease toxin of MazEF toxin-antitoxin module
LYFVLSSINFRKEFSIMFLLKKCIIPMSSSLVMCLSFIAFSMGNVAVFAATSNVQAIETAVSAFKTIGTLRKESPINADAIAAAYTGALQTLVQEVDTDNSLKLDSDILAAIEEIKSENEPSLAAQVIDKTLQRVFYQSIWNRITAIRDQFETATSAALVQMLDESVASFQAITGTVARANQVLTADRQSIEEGSNPGLDIQINESFARVRTALNKSNPTEDFATIAVERYVIRMSLARAYYIGVLREVGGIIANRDGDLEEAREAQKEGEIFYRIIESLISRDNPTGSALIKAQLTGNVSDVVADEIVSELSKGLIGRIKGEMKGQEESIGKDRVKAMAEASGAVSFAKILLPDLELRLGASIRSNLETALSNLQSASSENSVPKSAEARQAILAILDSYESELNLAKYNKANDTSLIVDGAVSSFQAIGVLRKENPINAEAIAAEYAGDLQQLTQLVDQAYGLSIDQDVLTAIEFIKNGNQAALAAQAIDKSLQRVFALVVYNRITLVADHFDHRAADELALEWDRAYAAYLAIIGTAAKENKVLTADKQTLETGSNPDLDDQITLAFVNGREALNKASANDWINVAIARENIVIPLIRAFLIGVLREVEGVISDRDADVAEAREKQIEGEFFYRIVEGFVSQDNPSGNSRIKAQLTGDMANVVANEIVSEISRGLIGQINRNISQIESTFGVDKNQAILASERVSLYANIFLPDLELRLSSLQRVKMENALQDLKEACETNNSSKAIAAGSTIIQIISAYENELI